MNEQKSALLHREDSDAESNVSDQSSISARSVMSTKSAQSAISRQSDGSSMCEQSRVTVQFSRSAQSGTSVQASKCTPAGKSSRPLRSVRKNGAVYHTKLFKCGECGKVSFHLMMLYFEFLYEKKRRNASSMAENCRTRL